MRKRRSDLAIGATRTLLLLAPSAGFGGGIERVADSIQAAWSGPVVRVDLYRPHEVAVPEGHIGAKVRFAWRAAAAAIRSRPDGIICVHVNFLPIAMLLRRGLGSRVGIVGHGVEVWSPFPWYLRRLIARCDWRLAVSSFTASWMAYRAGIEKDRVQVVPLPINASLAALPESAREPIPVPEDGVVRLLTVTRLVREHRFKGYFDVADALPPILARRPQVRWVVVGHGDDLPAIRERCRELGIDRAVEFTGRIDDQRLAELYRQADLFVLPSVAEPEATPPMGEGFGLVFAEAGAFGLPAIGSSAGGGSLEIVLDQETGVTVPPYDSQALIDAILELVDDVDLRRRLGEGARRRVLCRHMPHHFAAALERICSAHPRSDSGQAS